MKTYIIDDKLDQGLQVFVDTAQQGLESPLVKRQSEAVASNSYFNRRNMLSDIFLFCFLMSTVTLVYCFATDKPVWATIERVYFLYIGIVVACIFFDRKHYFVEKSNGRNFTTTFSEIKFQPNKY